MTTAEPWPSDGDPPPGAELELVDDELGSDLARQDELTARAQTYAEGARARSTWQAYLRQWARFERWCIDAGDSALPADPLTVAQFLADLAPVWRPATPADPHDVIVEGQVQEQAGMRPGTLDGYLAAISVVHQTADVENPVRAEVVRRTMAGIRRHRGVAPTTRRAAARRGDLAAILALLDAEEHLADARDAALLLIGWKAALRSDDLSRMCLEDVRITTEGLAIGLRRSKTDQDGTGTTVGIAPTPPAAPRPEDRVGEEPAVVSLDAVAAWARWRNLLAGHGITTGPAWRGIDRHGRRPRAAGLHRNSIRLIVTRRAAAAGYDATAWGAHSLRRGFATEAIAQGVPERDVQRHGRWRSRAAMAPYIDEARTFDATNPTHWLH